MLQLISLLLVAYSFFLIRISIPLLPTSIPTHFNAAGVADAWGSPDVLWVMLGAQALTCTVLLVAPYVGERFQWAMHIGSRRISDFPLAMRATVLLMLKDMAAYLSIVMNVFFVLMLHEVLEAAKQPLPHLHPFIPLALLGGGMFGIMLYYLARFRRIAKGQDGADSLCATSDDGPSCQ